MISRVAGYGYTRLRGRDLPNGMSNGQVLEFAVRYGVQVARGIFYGRRYASRGTLHFRGKRVRVRNPKNLFVGHHVAFDEEVTISAFGGDGIHLGDRVTVARGATLAVSGVVAEPGEYIRIGNHSAIGMFNVIWGQGGVSIGKDCLLGPHVVLVSENHEFGDPAMPIRQQGYVRAPIEIGDDCWLGAGVVVGPGVSIGPGAVIGAGAVVTRDVPALGVAVGAPASVVRFRGEAQG